jgi:hypothetical protein
MLLAYSLTEQACGIYMERAALGPDGPPLNDRLDRLKTDMTAFTNGSPVEHVTVWVTFIAAAESSLQEHYDYFLGVLTKHYDRNGFSNIRKAIHYLKKRRSEGCKQDWLEQFPSLPVFVV